MGINVIAPQRFEKIANISGTPNLRVAKFFEEISRSFSGLAEQMANIADVAITASTVSAVTQGDATTAGATYDQTQVNTVVDLTNANKAGINNTVVEFNKAIADLGTLKDKINAILAEMQTAGIMA